MSPLRRVLLVTVGTVVMLMGFWLLRAGSIGNDQPEPVAVDASGEAAEPSSGEPDPPRSESPSAEPGAHQGAEAAPPTTTTTSTAPAPIRAVPDEPEPDPPAPAAGVEGEFGGRGVAVVAAGGADLALGPGEDPFVRAHQGLAFGAVGLAGDWIQLFTTCDTTAWAHRSELFLTAPAPPQDVGPGFDLASAVVVIDPGHGGPSNIGAVGPRGTEEKVLNVDIARRVRDLLEAPRLIDWETGRIAAGDAVPAVRRVWLTRVEGPTGADYEAGLQFRSTMANAAGAHVVVSIHNNAGYEIDLEQPGSDVFYQSQLPESRRLAAILAAEFQRSFSAFDAAWVGTEQVGAKSRLSPRDGQTQYYGILRRTEAPAVIAEGAYLSNPSEEALLATPRFRQAYAEAVYRALVRFLTTDDDGSNSFDPEVWTGFAGRGDATAECEIPAQQSD